MELKLVHRTPTVNEYNALRLAVGWPVFDPTLVREALSKTLFSVCIESDGAAIAMGRVIGDNAIYLHVQDVIVHPDFQRRGLGIKLMEALLRYIDTAGGSNTNIGLMCSKDREEFYKAFGFVARPNEKFGAGMIKIKA